MYEYEGYMECGKWFDCLFSYPMIRIHNVEWFLSINNIYPLKNNFTYLIFPIVPDGYYVRKDFIATCYIFYSKERLKLRDNTNHPMFSP